MKLTGLRQSKNVQDIRKQKPKVRTAANPFKESEVKGGRTNSDGSITAPMQEAKKSPIRPVKPITKIGNKVGLDRMESAASYDSIMNEIRNRKELEESAKPPVWKATQLSDPIFPKEFKRKKS